MKVFDIFFIYKIIERTFNGRQGVIHPIISGNNYSKRVIIRYDVSVNKFHKPELCMINRLILVPFIHKKKFEVETEELQISANQRLTIRQ